MSAHQYWRFYLPAYTGWYFAGGAIVEPAAMCNIVFYDATNTPIPTTGGTATALSTAFGSPAGAFGNPSSSYWVNGHAFSPVFPNWLQMKFASAVAVDHFSFSNIAVSGIVGYLEAPLYMSLQYSDDGTTFSTYASWTGIPWLNSAENQTFTLANAAPASPGIIWYLNITAPTGSGAGSGNLCIGDWLMYDQFGALIDTTAMAADAANEYLFIGDSDMLMFAFDGDCDTAAVMVAQGANSWPGLCWLSYAFPTVQQISKICIVSPSESNISGTSFSQMPTAFQLQYSLDGGATRVTAGSYTFTWTAGCQSSCFEVTPPSSTPLVFAFTNN